MCTGVYIYMLVTDCKHWGRIELFRNAARRRGSKTVGRLRRVRLCLDFRELGIQGTAARVSLSHVQLHVNVQKQLPAAHHQTQLRTRATEVQTLFL